MPAERRRQGVCPGAGHSRLRTGLALSLLATEHIECMVEPIERAIVLPPAETVVGRAARRQVFRDRKPLAAGAQHSKRHLSAVVDVRVEIAEGVRSAEEWRRWTSTAGPCDYRPGIAKQNPRPRRLVLLGGCCLVAQIVRCARDIRVPAQNHGSLRHHMLGDFGASYSWKPFLLGLYTKLRELMSC